MRDPFVVANGQKYVVMITHRRVNGVATVNIPTLSAWITDKTRPKLDSAFVMESK